MKRLLVTFALLATLLVPSLAFAGSSSAVDIFPNCGAGGTSEQPEVCKEVNSPGANKNPIVTIISQIIMVVTYIVGVAAVIGIILSGIRFMTANGDSGAVAAARTGLIYALVGLLVALLAGFLVAFVINKT